MARLDQGEVHVYLAEVGKALERMPASLRARALSAQERAAWDRLRRRPDADAYLVAHSLLRIALSRHAPLHPAEWSFSRHDAGKPYIVNAGMEWLECNLAHTRGYVACIVGAGAPLGVDVESTQRRVNWKGVARVSFSEAEQEMLANLSHDAQQRDLFFVLWTLKEAYVKANGAGIRFPLQHVSFSQPEEGGVAARFETGVQDDPEAWSFRSLRVGAHHWAAAAVRCPRETVQWHVWQAELPSDPEPRPLTTLL